MNVSVTKHQIEQLPNTLKSYCTVCGTIRSMSEEYNRVRSGLPTFQVENCLIQMAAPAMTVYTFPSVEDKCDCGSFKACNAARGSPLHDQKCPWRTT